LAFLYPDLSTIMNQKVLPTEGELYLLKYLQDALDDDVEIYFQPFLNGDKPDVILLQRYAGITIIEVKDWNLDHYYLDEKAHWILEHNQAQIKSPIAQVETYKNNLFGLHIYGLAEKKALNTRYYGIVKTAIYFHKETTNRINEFMQRDRKKQYSQLLSSNNLHTLDLPRKYNENNALFTDDIYQEMIRYCQPPFHALEQGQDIVYSKRQDELTVSQAEHKKIRGAAGSGKTMVLAKRAVNAHKRHGKAVLILTFNLALKNYIHDNISDVRENFKWDNFKIINYHQFFKSEANNHNLHVTDLSTFDDETFFDCVKNKIEKFETILIDEIQDYKTTWIRLVKEYFLEGNGELIVFGDEKQNIYDNELDKDHKPNTTIMGRWNELKESYRMGSMMANIASEFQKTFFIDKYETELIEIYKRQGAFDFTGVYDQQFLYEFLSENTKAELLANKIFAFARNNKIHPNDITVIGNDINCLRELDYSIRSNYYENTITSFESHELYEHIRNDQDRLDEVRRNKKNAMWMNGGTMKIITAHSFKGMETPVGILVLTNKKSLNDELVYTAITRCRYKLYILNLENLKYHDFFSSMVSKNQ